MPVIIKTIIQTIAPFYSDEGASAPQPFPCMLTDQLELYGKAPPSTAPPSTSLLADEPLPTMPSTGTTSSPPPSREFRVFSRLRSPQPSHVRVASPYSKSRASVSSDSTDTTSDTESTTSTLSEDSKIPKPAGEPGRPGRGGYTLETALGWNQKVYEKFKKFMHARIGQHLDVTKCASAQDTDLLDLVKQQAMEKFPDLENYNNCWPVNDMIMMHLKYTSSRARRQELQVAAAKSKKLGTK